MKVKLEIELDLPENFDGASEAEIAQAIYDGFIKVPYISYMMQLIELESSTLLVDRARKKVYTEWAKITKEPKWRIIND